MGSTPSRFYELEANKILADGEKISLFTNHPGTLGSYREARLREYIAEHVSKRYAVSSGFITTHDPELDNIQDATSKQSDCLVYDEQEFAPLLRAADFSVVEPRSAAAVIEIKSNLVLSKKRPTDGADSSEPVWGGTFVDALVNVLQATRLLLDAGVPRDSFFAGILSYGGSSLGQVRDAFTSGSLLQQLGITDLDLLPNINTVFDGN
jgi:hypothetical protein